jgi:choice-of-anchor B domain-containing protein
MYVRGHHLYQANYRAGLRVFHLDRIDDGRLERLGFFDVYPADDAAEFNGAWGVYPFFPSGVVAVSGIEQGLFLLQLVDR